MGSIRVRTQTGKLFFDFRFSGKRCREQTALDDTPANRKKLLGIMERIDAEIVLGSFEYGRYFPNSSNAGLGLIREVEESKNDTPLFATFAETWFAEMRAQWRDSYSDTIRGTMDKYLIPQFGELEVGTITKADILQFRAALAQSPGRGNGLLSPSRINHIITPLRLILNEAANRHNYSSPYEGIKSLKVPRTQVEPFSLEEVNLILKHVRADYRIYFLVRFFTGMRTSEIHGLPWKKVDFNLRQMQIHQALVKGKIVPTKNDGSFRSIDMSNPVFDALQVQKEISGEHTYVFSNRAGDPLNANNVNNRIWLPLLRYLNLDRRRMYQTRHTAATLWLASGESPEWIARQMGHSTTEMLFRVYSRYVPNLTRQDGSAFERLLTENLNY
ncbi:MAG: DUF3596 domain-containing protein [Candidatus Sedimenticola sp. (ex Thyasira tokunagai)]